MTFHLRDYRLIVALYFGDYVLFMAVLTACFPRSPSFLLEQKRTVELARTVLSIARVNRLPDARLSEAMENLANIVESRPLANLRREAQGPPPPKSLHCLGRLAVLLRVAEPATAAGGVHVRAAAGGEVREHFDPAGQLRQLRLGSDRVHSLHSWLDRLPRRALNFTQAGGVLLVSSAMVVGSLTLPVQTLDLMGFGSLCESLTASLREASRSHCLLVRVFVRRGAVPFARARLHDGDLELCVQHEQLGHPLPGNRGRQIGTALRDLLVSVRSVRGDRVLLFS